MTSSTAAVDTQQALPGKQGVALKWVNKTSSWLDAFGFTWLIPLLKIAAGDNRTEQMKELRQVLLIPLLGISIFLLAWALLAPRVTTSLGAIPVSYTHLTLPTIYSV